MVKVKNRFHALGEEREIASVDQDVAVGHIDDFVALKLVGVAEEDEAQRGV